MSVTVTAFESTESDTWNEYVEQSPQGRALHRYEALSLLAGWSNSELHTLVGHKGQEPVGVLPVFVSNRGPMRIVRSPPDLEVFSLGPALLNFGKLSQRKTERRHREFVDGCLDWIREKLDPDYVDIRTVAGYEDVRPFTWGGFDVSPTYTYHVDLTPGREAVLEGFSRDARSNVTGVDAEYTIREDGREEVGTVIDQIEERHRDQEKEYPLDSEQVTDLYDVLPRDQMRVYTLSQDGEVRGGIVTLESGDTVRRWQGGATPDVDLPVNDLLDWHIMTESMDRGVERYDMVGANLPHLCRYKAKFNPTPVPYYVAKWRSNRMRAASTVYDYLPSGLVSL